MSRHAYLIMAHHNFLQLFRLLKFLDSPCVDIFLHVDKNAKTFEQKKTQQVCTRAKLTIIHRKSLAWGGDSLTKCEVAMLKAALPGKYDYYHLISGEDVPLLPIKAIHGFFDENKGKEFVSVNWNASDKPNSDIYNRIRYYNWFQNYVGRGASGYKRILWELQLILKNIQKRCGVDRCKKLSWRLGKGSQWFSITHEFAQYMVSYYESNLKRAFAFSYGTDELLVQTSLINNPSFLAQQYKDGNMRLIDWERSVDGCSPYTFTSEDYDMMMDSGKIWARKVSETVDNEVIDKIYQAIDSNN